MEDNQNKIRTQEPTLRLKEKQKHLEELCQELEAETKKQRVFGWFKKNRVKKNIEIEEQRQKKKDDRGNKAELDQVGVWVQVGGGR